MSRIAVTGASGFIGRHVVTALVQRGHDVDAVVSRQRASWRASDGVGVTPVNLLDRRERLRWLDEHPPDACVHLAWYAVPGLYWTSPENDRWLESTSQLFDELAARGCRRIVGVGTCAEYDWSGGICCERRTPIRPTTPYGIAKAKAHEALDGVADRRGVSAAWARIFFPFGPGEAKERLVPSVIRAALAGEPVRCTHGRQVRDFLYVGEVASALAALVESGVEGPVNLASGTPMSVRDLVQALVDRIGCEVDLRFGALTAPANDVPRLEADTTRLRDEVGWRPALALDDALDFTIEWWRKAVEP